jgi:hypothetical protein
LAVRYLLSHGNEKLGSSIFGWTIPAIQTCPGRSETCSRVCFATHGRFVTHKVKELMAWRYEQSKRADFVDRMVNELFRRSVLVLRVHVSGDFATPSYTRKWIEIAARSPKVRFFAYTRSYRVPKIEAHLRVLAALSNFKLWYSADCDTGVPPNVPPGVRVAWLQHSETPPAGGDLVFQVQKLRRLALPMAIPVCEQELPEGKARGTTCSNCHICWT